MTHTAKSGQPGHSLKGRVRIMKGYSPGCSSAMHWRHVHGPSESCGTEILPFLTESRMFILHLLSKQQPQ